MKKMILLCSLFSMNLAFANAVGYTQFAECKGEMMDGGTMVSATFTLLVEDDFCSKESTPKKGLIMDHTNGMLSALEATVLPTSGGVVQLSSSVDIPELGREVEILKFDITVNGKATLSLTDFEGDREVVSKFDFTCNTTRYHLGCL